MTTPPLIIGVAGRKGAGKTTIANQLHLVHGFRAFAFADLIKKICAKVFNLGEEQLDGKLKETPLWPLWSGENWTPRTLMQKVGDIGRTGDFSGVPAGYEELFQAEFAVRELNIGPACWIDPVMHAIDAAQVMVPGLRCVVQDVRFPNEAAAIRERGGFVWKVVREGCVHDSHNSEAHIDSLVADEVFENNGTIEKLQHAVNGAVQALNRGRERRNPCAPPSVAGDLAQHQLELTHALSERDAARAELTALRTGLARALRCELGRGNFPSDEKLIEVAARTAKASDALTNLRKNMNEALGVTTAGDWNDENLLKLAAQVRGDSIELHNIKRDPDDETTLRIQLLTIERLLDDIPTISSLADSSTPLRLAALIGAVNAYQALLTKERR